MLNRSVFVSLLLVSFLAACSKQEPAPPAQSAAPNPTSTVASPATDAIPIQVAQADGRGKQVYDQSCSACHLAGVAGAPKFGDKAAWAPRIAQGMDTLYTHSLKGFQGKSGVMPPKGGNMSLSDADVKAAVDYMVSKAK